MEEPASPPYVRSGDGSAADVALIDAPSGDFVQLGWMDNNGSPILPASQGWVIGYQMFAGEFDPQTGGERLYPLQYLAPGWHGFFLQRDEATLQYVAYHSVPGGAPQRVWTSTFTHRGSMRPEVVSEVNIDCSQIALTAYDWGGPPYDTLRLHRESTGYVLWQEHWGFKPTNFPVAYPPGCWVDGQLNGTWTATDITSGPTGSVC